MVLRMMPSYDKDTLIEAVHICLDKGIYNGESVKNLCELVYRSREKEQAGRTVPCHNRPG